MDKIPTTMVHSGPNDTDCNIYLKQFKSGHYVYVAALTSSPKGMGATEEVNYCSIKKLSNSFICLFFSGLVEFLPNIKMKTCSSF